jgi:uncharacterized iron-regulated membrane protein
MRKLFALHSWLGLTSGLVLLVAGLSASVLLFKHELEAALNPGWMKVQPGAEPLGLEELARRVQRDPQGGRIVSLRLDELEQPGRSLHFTVAGPPKSYPGRGRTAYVDPYRGEVLGSRQGRFLDWLYFLHFEFLLGGFGRGLMFFFALFMFLLGLSGLWIYREGFRGMFRSPRKGGGLRLWLADWHKAIGLWTLLLFLLVGFTGTYMNWRIFPYFAKDWGRVWSLGLVGDWSTRAPFATELKRDEVPDAIPLQGLDRAFQAGRAALPEMRPHSLSFPSKAGGPLTISGPSTGPWGFLLGKFACRVKVGLDGTVLEARSPAQMTALEKFRSVCDELHIGRYGGLPVKLLYALFGLAPGLLAVTGFLMYLHRAHQRIFT